MCLPTAFRKKIILSALASVWVLSMQAQQNQQVIEKFCAKKILPERYCTYQERSGSTYEILQQCMARYNEAAEETGIYVDDLFNSNVIAESNNYWLKGDSSDLAYGRPPHPDSIKFYKKESQQLVSLLSDAKLISAVQVKKINQALKANTIIHPLHTLRMAHALLMEEELNSGTFAKNLIDSLRVVFPSNPYQGTDIAAFLSAAPEHYTLTLNAPLVTPGTAVLSLENLLKSIQPGWQTRPVWRLSTQGFSSGCQIPVKRYEVIFGVPLGLPMDCTFELHARETPEGPMLEAASFAAADNLVNWLMQLEQNQESAYTGFLMFNWEKTRNQLLQSGFQLPPNEFDAQKSGQIHFLRLTEAQYECMKKMVIPFGDELSMRLDENLLFHRYPKGLSVEAKVRVWQKLIASKVMDRHEPAAQEYLWANLSAYPMADSLEMLRQLFLADYPDVSRRMDGINQLFGKTIRRMYQIELLKDISRGEVKVTDFTDLKMESSDATMKSIFYFHCAGKPFTVNLDTRDPVDLVVLAKLAAAWHEMHPDKKRFYFIAQTRLILFLSSEEAEKFSEHMNLLLIPI